ncbi:MAG: type II secretion system F family protein [Verrucomicrobiota bacterium]
MKFSKKQKQQLYYELEKFVRSGFGFDKACESMVAQPATSKIQKNFCEGVLEGLKNKKTVAQSVEALPLEISELEINIINAGEQAGLLEKSFEHLEKHFGLALETEQKIKKALVYPIMLLHAAILMGLTTTSLMAAWNPLAEKGAGWASFKVGLTIVVILYAVLAFSVTIFVKWLKMAKHSAEKDRLLAKIPFLGRMRRDLAMSNFCGVFHMGLCSGQKMDQVYLNAGKSSSSGQIWQVCQNGAENLRKGETLAITLTEAGNVFPRDFKTSVANAELAGVVDEEFARWKDYYRKCALDSVSRFVEWVPRLFYWLVLVVVVFIVFRMAISYRDLLENYINWSDQF